MPLIAVALRGEAGLPPELLAEVLRGAKARLLRDLRHGKVSGIKEFLGMAHAQGDVHVVAGNRNNSKRRVESDRAFCLLWIAAFKAQGRCRPLRGA